MKYWSAHAKKHLGNAGLIEPADETRWFLQIISEDVQERAAGGFIPKFGEPRLIQQEQRRRTLINTSCTREQAAPLENREFTF